MPLPVWIQTKLLWLISKLSDKAVDDFFKEKIEKFTGINLQKQYEIMKDAFVKEALEKQALKEAHNNVLFKEKVKTERLVNEAVISSVNYALDRIDREYILISKKDSARGLNSLNDRIKQAQVLGKNDRETLKDRIAKRPVS